MNYSTQSIKDKPSLNTCIDFFPLLKKDPFRFDRRTEYTVLAAENQTMLY